MTLAIFQIARCLRWRFFLPLLLVPLALARLAPVAAADQDLQHLAALLEQRLVLSEGVAQAKWNSGQAIADPAREQAVIEAVVLQATDAGVDPAFARRVIEAQIAASRLLQQDLHATWTKQGLGPFPDAPDLRRDLRPKFDALTGELVLSLKQVEVTLRTDQGRATFVEAANQAMATRPAAVRDTALAPFLAQQ